MIVYPYTLSDLVDGDVPVDGRPVFGVHFNRIFREVTAIQGALGPGERLKGNLSDFATRIDGEMNTDGSLERELITDDDYSVNKRGMTRFVDGQQIEDTISVQGSTAGNTTFVPLAFNAWEEPPAFFFMVGRDTGTYHIDLTRQLLLDISEIGARLEHRRFNGVHGQNTVTFHVHWIAISRNAQVWEDNVAWALPPVRAGS